MSQINIVMNTYVQQSIAKVILFAQTILDDDMEKLFEGNLRDKQGDLLYNKIMLSEILGDHSKIHAICTQDAAPYRDYEWLLKNLTKPFKSNLDLCLTQFRPSALLLARLCWIYSEVTRGKYEVLILDSASAEDKALIGEILNGHSLLVDEEAGTVARGFCQNILAALKLTYRDIDEFISPDSGRVEFISVQGLSVKKNVDNYDLAG